MSDSKQQDLSQGTAARTKMQQVQNNFGVAAADYVTSKVHASGEDLAWVVETARLTGIEHVLDVATGGGHTAFALAPQAAEIVALDLTQEMLTVAQRAATERQLSNIRFQKGDAQNLPFDDACFDLVTCRHAPHHFPDVRQAVQEWARVLKPGGRLVLVDSMAPEEPESDEFLQEIETLRDPSHVRNYRISEWRTFLNESGFTVQSAREWKLFLDIPDWTKRMRTPEESVATIERRFQEADAATRARLGIEKKDGVSGFMLPVILAVATKEA